MSSRTKQSRKPDLRRYYKHRLPKIEADDLTFRVRILRRGGQRPLIVNPEELAWSERDDQGVSGTLQLNRPDPDDASSLPVGRGMRVETAVRWGGDWYKLLTLRLGVPSPDPETGAVFFDTNDEFASARLTRRDWRFRKDKGRPKGWLGHDAARYVCRKSGIKVRTLARTKVRLKSFKKLNAHPIAALLAIYEEERRETGRRFIVRYRDGALEVVPYRRNRVLFVFNRPADVEVTLTGSVEPITVLTGKAKMGKGSGAKELRFTQKDSRMVKRFGYRHKVKSYGHVDGPAELRRKVLRDYADGIRVRRTATFTVPMIPFLRRGDGCQLILPSEGFDGARSFVYISEVAHDAKARRSTLTVEEADPFRAYQRELDKRRRDAKRKKKKK